MCLTTRGHPMDKSDYEKELSGRREAEREALVRARKPHRDPTPEERIADLERRIDQLTVLLLSKRT